MTPLTYSFWAGTFYVAAGLCALTQHWLLEPKMVNYPKAPPWLLHVYFGFATVLIFAGFRFLWVWGTGAGATIPPGASAMGVLLSLSVFVYKLAMLYNVASQRFPAETWERLNRINDMARCPPWRHRR